MHGKVGNVLGLGLVATKCDPLSVRNGDKWCVMTSAIGLVLFVTASDLIWLATDARGGDALPTIIFRTAFYTFCWIACRRQMVAIGAHLQSLERAQENASRTGTTSGAWEDELGSKIGRYRIHLYAHRVFGWFIGCFGVYCVLLLMVGTQGLLPKAVPLELFDDLSYLLLYLFLGTCILRKLIT